MAGGVLALDGRGVGVCAQREGCVVITVVGGVRWYGSKQKGGVARKQRCVVVTSEKVNAQF